MRCTTFTLGMALSHGAAMASMMLTGVLFDGAC